MKGIGLGFALRGIAEAVRSERNLRIHLTAVFYVSACALIGRAERGTLAAVFLCFGLVVALELVNTALERLCDLLHPARHPVIGQIKNIGSGAVLAAALAAVAVAAVLLMRAELWERVLHSPWSLVPLGLAPLWCWFVVGPRRWRDAKQRSSDIRPEE